MNAVSLPHRAKSYNGATKEEVQYKRQHQQSFKGSEKQHKGTTSLPPLQSLAEKLSYATL